MFWPGHRWRERSSAALALLLLTACNSPTDAVPCATRWADARWTPLGLDGAVVATVEDTEWGLFAGTAARGVFRLDESSGEWEGLGLEEFQVNSLRFVGPPDRLLAAVSANSLDEAIIHASEDRGQTWLASDSGLALDPDRFYYSAYDLAVDPRDRRRVFAGTSDWVLRSTDAGVSWETVLDGRFPVVGFAPVGGGVVLASRALDIGATRLYRSPDAGESWRMLDLFPFGSIWLSRAFTVDHRTPERVWMAVEAVVWRSENAGNLWTPGPEIAADRVVFGMVEIDGALVALISSHHQEVSSVSVSCDLGDSWESVAVPAEIGGAETLARGRDGSLIVGTRGAGAWRLEPIGR
jgi:hypothetical protein